MIYLKDSYTKSFEEKILLVEGDKIITQDSSFYAQSGGQPGDKGVLEINDKKFNVINTVKHELGIAHVVDSENLNLSGQIKGHIDWGSSISLNENAHHNALNVCSITLLCYRRINWFRKK